MWGWTKKLPQFGWGWSNTKSDGGATSLPVFRVTFDSNITPEIGTAGTYTRAGTAYYNDSLSTVASKTANNACVPAYISGLATAHGYQQLHDVKNLILRSQEFSNATWTSVGTGSATADTATAPDGTATADTISGSAGGDGKQQDSGIAAASTNAYIFSVWLRSTSGTPSVSLVIKDGGAQSNTNAVSISTTWKRYAVYYKFTAAPAGNVIVQILVGNTSTVRAWGAQLDESQASPYTYQNEMTIAGNLSFGGYVPTTTAVATQSQDLLVFTGSEVTTVRTKVSLLVWMYRPTFTDIWQPCWIVSTSSSVHGVEQGLIFSNNSYKFDSFYGGNSGAVNTTAFGTADQFNQVIIVSDFDSDSYQTYVNGTLVETNSTARAPLAAIESLNIGHQYNGDNSRFTARTIIGRVELYDVALDATQAQTLYNDQKGAYGL